MENFDSAGSNRAALCHSRPRFGRRLAHRSDPQPFAFAGRLYPCLRSSSVKTRFLISDFLSPARRSDFLCAQKYLVMAKFGRFLRRVGGRAVRIAKAVWVAGMKIAVDAVLNQGRATISFEHLGGGRHDVYLLFALTRVGAVGCSARDAHRAWACLPLRDFIRNVRINWRGRADGILLTDNTNGPGTLQISSRYYSSPPADHRLFAPYFAHPEFYRAGLHNDVRRMRGRERNVRIFFAGTVSRSAYCDKFGFPILSRDKILDHVIAKFESAIETELGRNGWQSIVILLTSDTSNIFDKHRLSLTEYMDAMSRADFFICPPGWLMPHSHNLIEAMSVGTIPITNYYSYMRPSLTPNGNCLAFSTLEELERIINCALCMSGAEVKRLRDGAISYYEEYLDPESFGKKVRRCLPSISEIVVNDESAR
jgi:glycosyltransferase involved in cell wall biosynthesis